MVRFSPYNVSGRLFRDVADRPSAPWDDLVEISGRASEGRLSAVFFGQRGRVAPIGLLDVEANVFRLRRFEREEARGVDVRRACFVSRFD